MFNLIKKNLLFVDEIGLLLWIIPRMHIFHELQTKIPRSLKSFEKVLENISLIARIFQKQMTKCVQTFYLDSDLPNILLLLAD